MPSLSYLADVALAVKSNVAVIEILNREVERLEARLLESVRLRPEYTLLKSIPGIGEVLAIVIMLETGDRTLCRSGQFCFLSPLCRQCPLFEWQEKRRRQHQEW